ncbi:MAG: hypothetical protein JRN20_04975 [Nitrososphaerota archaeon]|nr:hypothetical protein [Nitrososphaerota archaeon]MDG6922105.1 hypothetical protein [Nitrososphaerota archaeon]
MLSEEQTIGKVPTAESESIAGSKKSPRESEELRLCDYCGADLSVLGLGLSDRRKYCSKNCQSRASQGRIRARLDAPLSKRYAARLKFSDPLYFN